MKRLLGLVVVLLAGLTSALADNSQCVFGWGTEGLASVPIGQCGWYASAANGAGTQNAFVQVLCTGMPDPANNYSASPIVSTSGTHQVLIYVATDGCVYASVDPNGDVFGASWPAVDPTTTGYYHFDMQINYPGAGGFTSQGTFNAFCTAGVWSLYPGDQNPGFTPGIGQDTGVWDPTGHNYIYNRVRVFVTRNGAACGDGVNVTLTRTTNGQTFTAKTYNGECSFDPVWQEEYTVQLSGTVTEGSAKITYSGGVDFTKGAAEMDMTIACDQYGSVQTVTENGVSQSVNASGGGGSTVSQGAVQTICQALFVPSNSSILGAEQSMGQFQTWGPFGFINAMLGDLQQSVATPDPYWENGPMIAFPDMDPTTGLLKTSTSISRSQADISIPWQTEPVWQNVRAALGAVVWVLFALHVARWLRPKFTV